MSETEIRVKNTIVEALPKMNEKQLGYILGYAEAIAELVPDRSEQEEKKENEKAAVTA